MALMKRAIALLGLLFFAHPAQSADSTVSGMTGASALDGTELYYCVQGGADRKCTGAQVKSLTNTAAVTTQTGTNYAFASSDVFTIVYLNNASNQIPTIPQAGTTGFETGKYFEVCNIGAGTQTLTPTTSTIGGAATFVLAAGAAATPRCVGIVSDGANYKLDLTGPYAIGALGTVTPGTGVATAAAANLSAAGGLTSTIASGTSALATGAISSATCATVVTTAATNTATTDVVGWGFNGDPTAVTGYTPVTTGALTIFAYPTSGNVNFKVCNLTASSITPGAITLNWRITR